MDRKLMRDQNVRSSVKICHFSRFFLFKIYTIKVEINIAKVDWNGFLYFKLKI